MVSFALVINLSSVLTDPLIVKRSSGPTPASSEHPSRPSFDDARVYRMELMQQCQLDHRKARDAKRSYANLREHFHLTS